MQLIEKFTKGKHNNNDSEDRLFFNKDFVAVVDGVSSKCSFRLDGKSTGQIAADLVCQALETLRPEADLHEILAATQERFGTFYRSCDFPYDRRSYGPQAVMAIYSRRRRELHLIGDTQCLVDGVHHCRPKPSDLLFAQLRCMVLEIFAEEKQLSGSADLSPAERQAARAYIEDWIVRATCFANRSKSSYGYAVLDGQTVPEELVLSLPLDAGAHEVVLATDGYPRLFSSLEASELALARLLEEDPHCCANNPQTKGLQPGCYSFDDRSYIRLAIPALD